MRIYPFRNTRNYWRIPLYCRHECTSTCRHILTIDDDMAIHLKLNPLFDEETEQCVDHGRLTRTSIDIATYTITRPRGDCGELFEPDVVVIPDIEFTIVVKFPIKTPVEFKVDANTSLTLRQLLMMIKHLYTHIYDEEEKTATPTPFSVQKRCMCENVDLTHILRKKDLFEQKGDCSVCFDPFEKDNATVLECNHSFHNDCLLKWIEKGKGDNCPLCRAPLYKCSQCNGTKIIIETRHYVVLPVHLRNPDSSMMRNTTDGVYGIHSWDLDSLRITKMIYNKINKLLCVSVKNY